MPVGHNLDFGHFRRRHGVGNKNFRIFRPFDDIYFFAADFRQNGAHPRSFLADAGAHRINTLFIGKNCNFGAAAGLAGN